VWITSLAGSTGDYSVRIADVRLAT
jgi:hypothetical protein